VLVDVVVLDVVVVDVVVVMEVVVNVEVVVVVLVVDVVLLVVVVVGLHELGSVGVTSMGQRPIVQLLWFAQPSQQVPHFQGRRIPRLGRAASMVFPIGLYRHTKTTPAAYLNPRRVNPDWQATAPQPTLFVLAQTS